MLCECLFIPTCYPDGNASLTLRAFCCMDFISNQEVAQKSIENIVKCIELQTQQYLSEIHNITCFRWSINVHLFILTEMGSNVNFICVILISRKFDYLCLKQCVSWKSYVYKKAFILLDMVSNTNFLKLALTPLSPATGAVNYFFLKITCPWRY